MEMAKHRLNDLEIQSSRTEHCNEYFIDIFKDNAKPTLKLRQTTICILISVPCIFIYGNIASF